MTPETEDFEAWVRRTVAAIPDPPPEVIAELRRSLGFGPLPPESTVDEVQQRDEAA